MPALMFQMQKMISYGYFKLLGDSSNYMTPILVLFSLKRIAKQILVIAKSNGY